VPVITLNHEPVIFLHISLAAGYGNQKKESHAHIATFLATGIEERTKICEGIKTLLGITSA
jgi:hypothetical protein